MCNHVRKSIFLAVSTLCVCSATAMVAQQGKSSTKPDVSPEKAIALAHEGHCRESISPLKQAMAPQNPAEMRKEAGVVGVRCSLDIDNREATLEFIRLLNKQFAKDPD